MRTMPRSAMVRIAAAMAAATVGAYTVSPVLQGAASQVSSAFETVTTLPSANTENILEAGCIGRLEAARDRRGCSGPPSPEELVPT